MATLASLIVALGIDAGDYERGLNKAVDTADRAGRDIGGKLAGIGGALATGIVGGIGVSMAAMGGFLAYATKEASEAQEIQAQLGAVLTSTGAAAWITADGVNSIADHMAKATTFSDEMILGGQNLLLTFTNIGEKVFPAATVTMLDMSQALGQDLKASAMQLGKALQDPIEGVGALRRVGVTFTDEQEAMIKAMVKSGDVIGAQNLILQELQKEFGGSAAAAGKTFAGSLEILKNQLSNVAEGIGTSLLPILSDMMNKYIIPLVPHIETLGKVLSMALSGGDISGLVGSLPEQMQPIAEGLAWLATTVVNFVTVGIPKFIEGFMNIITFLMENKGVLIGILAAIGVAIAAWAISVVASMISVVISMAPILLVVGLLIAIGYLLYKAWTENWGGIQDKVKVVMDWLKENIPPIIEKIKAVIQDFVEKVKAWWAEYGDDVMAVAKKMWDFVWGIVKWAAGNIGNVIKATVDMIKLFWSEHGDTIMAVAKKAWETIKTIIDGVMKVVGEIFAAFRSAFEGDWRAFGEHLRAASDAMWEMIINVFRNAWDALLIIVKELVVSIVDFVKNTDWIGLGKSIILGIANGIRSAVGWLVDAAIAAARAALEAAKGFLGISSPSQVFADEVGLQMGLGVVEGFRRGLRGVETNIPVMNNVRGMQPVFINYTNRPFISTADEMEALNNLTPLLNEWLRSVNSG